MAIGKVAFVEAAVAHACTALMRRLRTVRARALATLLPLCLILTFAPARWLYRCLSIKNCALLLTSTPQRVPVYMLVLTSTPDGVAAAVTSCRSFDEFDS